MAITQFSIKADDLDGLDKKTMNALEPLINSLNNVIQQLVNTVNSLPVIDVRQITINTASVIGDSFPVTFRSIIQIPRIVILSNIQSAPGLSLTDPRVLQNWSISPNGQVSITNITGLEPEQTYQLTFLVL